MDQLSPTVVYTFGPFQFETGSRRLTRDRQPVALSERQADILLALLARSGEIVSKDALIEAAWQEVAVTDNSLEQAISSLRRTLDPSGAGPRYIETLVRRGYRFGVPVSRSVPRHSASALDAMLAPFRAFVEGRAALETLEREAVNRAGRVFEDVVQAAPDYLPAHIGLANALALQFEGARAQAVFDRDTLARALHHAGEACRLDPSSAEAWCVLGLASHQAGDTVRALAASQRAIALEPDNWRHRLRLAYVSWGEERLRAARRALELCPGLALAHWLAATVYIARQAFAEADRELVAGAAAQDLELEGARFRAAGLHLLLGLLRLSQGDETSALEELTRELAGDESPQIFTAQARANAWCAIGAHRLRLADKPAALDAFEEATRVMPDHPAALAARAGVTNDPDAIRNLERRLQELRHGGAVVEAAFGEAAFQVLTGRSERAPIVVHAALTAQPAGSAGWTLPVDPLLHVGAYPEHWEVVLALLRARAA